MTDQPMDGPGQSSAAEDLRAARAHLATAETVLRQALATDDALLTSQAEQRGAWGERP